MARSHHLLRVDLSFRRWTRHAAVLLASTFLYLPNAVYAAGEVGASALPGQKASATATRKAPKFVQDSILVKFKEWTSRGQKQRAYDAVSGRKVHDMRIVPGLEHLRLGRGVTPERAIDRLQRLPFVEYAQPDYIVELDDHHEPAPPNDPFFGRQWALDDFDATAGMNVERAWAVAQDTLGIVVAIVDSGVDITHPDLDDNIWINAGEIPGNGVDDDGNGFVDDVNGWDFGDGDADPSPGVGGSSHGTHVAGISCAERNNAIGVSGVTNCQIMALRMRDAAGRMTTAAGLSAIDYAVDNGARISNLSWGDQLQADGTYFGSWPATLDMLRAARDAGHLVIASAGNDSIDNDGNFRSPSSYNLNNIIAVAATDDTARIAGFSNFGAGTVDVGAPGVSIWSTILQAPATNPYAAWNGTSMATPNVTGVAALLWAQYPDWSYTQVRSQIFATVRQVDALDGLVSTGGIVDAYAALTIGLEPEHPWKTVFPAIAYLLKAHE